MSDSSAAEATAETLTSSEIPILRRSIVRDGGNRSDTMYARGFSRLASDNEIIELISIIENPIDIDFSHRAKAGIIWAKYSSSSIAKETISKLHQLLWKGVIISAKFELGVDSEGRAILPSNRHNTIVRKIAARKGADIGKFKVKGTYSSKSLIVDDVEYPFPSGLYLSRLIHMTRDIPSSDPMLRLLTDPCIGNNYPKEISEAMAMADAVQRALKAVLGSSGDSLTGYRKREVYVLGDGARPLCGAILCLTLPSSFKIISIDPLLKPLEYPGYEHRFESFTGMSQDYIIPETQIEEATCILDDRLTIVVACHSHAPLAEFWARVPPFTMCSDICNNEIANTKEIVDDSAITHKSVKIAIAMPCCAAFAALPDTPIIEYDDYEVYSLKRNVKIYSSKQVE